MPPKSVVLKRIRAKDLQYLFGFGPPSYFFVPAILIAILYVTKIENDTDTFPVLMG